MTITPSFENYLSLKQFVDDELRNILASTPYLFIPENWRDMSQSLQNGALVGVGPPSYYKGPDGVVRFKGSIYAPAAGLPTATMLFQLPIGFRPIARAYWVCEGGSKPYGISINTDGGVRVSDVGGHGAILANDWVDINPLSFRAEQ